MHVALELATVRDVSLVVVAGAVATAVIVAWAVRAVVSKLVTLAVVAAIGGSVWWQREDVQACAGDVAATLAPGGADDSTCRFFGRDVTVTSPLG